MSSIFRFYVMFTLFSHLISSNLRWMVCSPLLTPDRSAHLLRGIRGTGGQNWDRIHRTGSVTQISSLGKTLFPIPVIVFQGGRLKKTEFLKTASLVHRYDCPSPLLLQGYTVYPGLRWVFVA